MQVTYYLDNVTSPPFFSLVGQVDVPGSGQHHD